MHYSGIANPFPQNRFFFQNPRDAGAVCFLFFRMYAYLRGCVTPPDQAKNGRDLKFSIHTHQDHI